MQGSPSENPFTQSLVTCEMMGA
uniref:Uncharacterized protein n=1 Tax=Arundo donax TaxID=35708 RepID=A0A0A9BYY6_ARUDO